MICGGLALPVEVAAAVDPATEFSLFAAAAGAPPIPAPAVAAPAVAVVVATCVSGVCAANCHFELLPPTEAAPAFSFTR